MITPVESSADAAKQAPVFPPIRVLHVVGRMNRGGAETWLMQVLKHIDRSRFHLDFMTDTDLPGVFDTDIRASGSSVLRGPAAGRPWNHSAALARFFEQYGRYDIVHSHLHHYSGLVLRSAARAGVPVRIAHSHSDTRHAESRAHVLRRAYTTVTERWIRKYATRGLAVSGDAARGLFGGGWKSDPRVSVLYCGTDLEAFAPAGVRREDVRSELRLPAGATVYAHVGRFVEPKNHPFLIEIFGRIAAQDPRAMFVIAGDGPLRPSVEAALQRTQIASRTRLLGMRSDIPRLLKSAVDVLVLPSLWEGLPIVAIESQAAGVPCLCSDAVTPEVVEIPTLLRRIPLARPAEEWAQEAIGMARATAIDHAHPTLGNTRFDIRVGVRRLEEIYLSCLQAAAVLP